MLRDKRDREIKVGCEVRVERPMFKNRWGVVKSLEECYAIIRLNNRDFDSSIAPTNLVVLRGPKKNAKIPIPKRDSKESDTPITRTRRKTL